MTMHLHHPSLSLNGKKKGKFKFRNADEARKARELDESWKKLLAKHNAEQDERKRRRALEAPAISATNKPYIRDTGPRIPSLNGGLDMTPATKAPAKVYTGTKVLGIGTMHKSNAVPIFSDDEAKEISSMRR